MALNFTGKNDSKYELIEKGDYEVTLQCEWAKKKNDPSKLYINCKFKIREDVEQSFPGRLVFDSIYEQENTGDYNKTKINGLLGAIPRAKLDFEDYDELIQYLNGQNMVITIEVEKANQWHADDRNVVKYLSYRPSEVPTPVAATTTATPVATASNLFDDGMTLVDDGDLPF
jgi:hypothetical protein